MDMSEKFERIEDVINSMKNKLNEQIKAHIEYLELGITERIANDINSPHIQTR